MNKINSGILGARELKTNDLSFIEETSMGSVADLLNGIANSPTDVIVEGCEVVYSEPQLTIEPGTIYSNGQFYKFDGHSQTFPAGTTFENITDTYTYTVATTYSTETREYFNGLIHPAYKYEKMVLTLSDSGVSLETPTLRSIMYPIADEDNYGYVKIATSGTDLIGTNVLNVNNFKDTEDFDVTSGDSSTITKYIAKKFTVGNIVYSTCGFKVTINDNETSFISFSTSLPFTFTDINLSGSYRFYIPNFTFNMRSGTPYTSIEGSQTYPANVMVGVSGRALSSEQLLTVKLAVNTNNLYYIERNDGNKFKTGDVIDVYYSGSYIKKD